VLAEGVGGNGKTSCAAAGIAQRIKNANARATLGAVRLISLI
jgi:hypothetical protein